MPKQTIYLTSAADLSVRQNQLSITLNDTGKTYFRSFEDLRMIIIDHHSVHLTVPLMNMFAKNNIGVVFCDEHHNPTTMLMDLDSNSVQTKHFRAQLEAEKTLAKQIWKQIVERKIQNQSKLLSKLGIGDDILKPYYMNVKSGDVSNREGIAAKIYWRNLFGNHFVRDRFGPCPNDFLNYGYALLRSAVARAIMDAGLLPTVGVFHRNYYNSFPLADDLMEPYRPFVDERVFVQYVENKRVVDQDFKRRMMELFYETITQDELSATAHSLSRLFEKEGRLMYYPEMK